MTWGYRHEGIEKEFATKEELVEYLKRMDSGVLRYVRYWYIEENFEAQEVLRDLVDGVYKDITPEGWFDDALDAIASDFMDGHYDWKEDTIEGIYYRDDE